MQMITKLANRMREMKEYEKNIDTLKNSMPNLSEPTSILVKREVFKKIKLTFSKYDGFDLNQIIKKAKELKNNPQEYYNWITQKSIEIYEKTKGEDISLLDALTDAMDQAYIHINAKRFVIDVQYSGMHEYIACNTDNQTPDTVKNIDEKSFIDKIEDSMFDFRTPSGEYLPITVKYNQLLYALDYGNKKNLNPHGLCMILYTKGNENEPPKTDLLSQMFIIPEIYPKLLLNKAGYQHCSNTRNNNRCIKKQISLKDTRITDDKLPELKVEICQLTQRLATDAYCPMVVSQPWKLLKYISFAWDMYENRHTITRKNSKRKAGYTHNKVHVAKSDENEFDYSVIPLHTYYDTERKNHEWKGGHHASPVEHERAASYRRIFNEDGSIKKIVPVKGTTVNAGHTKDRLIKINAK